MLKLFKSKQPLVLILALLLVGALHIVGFTKPLQHEIAGGAILTGYVLDLLNLTGMPQTVGQVVAIILVFLQALVLNNVLEKHNFFSRSTFLATLIFIIISSLFISFLSLHPALIATTFLIPLLNVVFGFYKKQSAFKNIFDAGFLVGIASLFYFPSILFIIFVYITLNMLRPFYWREWLIGLIALLVPYFLLGTYLFWFDQVEVLLSGHLSFILEDYSLSTFEFTGLEYGLLGITGLFLLLSLFYMQAHYFRNVIRIRNFQLVILIMLLVSSLTFLFSPYIHMTSFYLVGIPLSVIITYYLNETRLTFGHELLFFLLLVLVGLNQYFPDGLYFIFEGFF